MNGRYSIGIDLGTTNSVLAYCPLSDTAAIPRVLPIPQIVASGTIEPRDSIPSFCYLPPGNEQAALRLPWEAEPPQVSVGVLARDRAAEVPDRVVVGAKSWLAYPRVDRRGPILPWDAGPEVPKISPLEASVRYLRHLVEAWNHAYPQALISDQVVVLTVPASFDPAARDLTRQAALSAGLPESLVLLEEPQAALYRWLAGHADRWRDELHAGDELLVVDVGGGTTDLTLIRLVDCDGSVDLQRCAVGNHLLVGGDNMDLAIAHWMAEKFVTQGRSLDPWQNISLWHACRATKERLLGEGGPESETISVFQRGSRLIGGTITSSLHRQELTDFLLRGFFPPCDAGARPEPVLASGFQDIGLQYESDPAITRHLAAFLSDHQSLPTHLLFNGGVFRAAPLRNAVAQQITTWCAGRAPLRLGGAIDLDHAVALGGAYYGWSKQRGGIRIRGGTARSFYIGIESSGPAIPGAPRPLRALCVAPLGMEEGTEVDVPGQEVGLLVGRPAKFRFFSSTTRKEDQPGQRLQNMNTGELIESDPIEMTLAADEVTTDHPLVPVHFQSRVTELGMFQLWCRSASSDQSWKMEFNAREDAQVARS